MIHKLKRPMDEQPLKVTLIGVGGTGSRVLIGLVNIHLGLLALGHPGLMVKAFDPDEVTESNLVRQKFYRTDLGRNKAIALVERINYSHGFAWQGYPMAYQPRNGDGYSGICLCCVDTRKARAGIYSQFRTQRWRYLMDFGNQRSTGQVILGGEGLPSAADLYPEIADDTLPEDDAPSCSALDSLRKQDLYVNEALAVAGLNILWTLLHRKEIEYHGVFLNLETGLQTPLKVTEPKDKSVRH